VIKKADGLIVQCEPK